MAKHIEVLARGLCEADGRLLICRTKGARNTYLPGGHVEFEEAAKDGLRREILEETGVVAEIGGLLGAIEHTFVQKRERHCELNLVFKVSAEALDPTHRIEAREKHIEFLWIPMRDLPASHLEPYPLRRLIPLWLSDRLREETWASTFPEE